MLDPFQRFCPVLYLHFSLEVQLNFVAFGMLPGLDLNRQPTAHKEQRSRKGPLFSLQQAPEWIKWSFAESFRRLFMDFCVRYLMPKEFAKIFANGGKASSLPSTYCLRR